MTGFRTPLGRARGLGSAKDGVGRFIGERVTAVALLFLVLWGVRSALGLARAATTGHPLAGLARQRRPHGPARRGGLPAHAGGHAVIVEDYIEKPATKAVLLLINAFVCWGGLALTVVCLAEGGVDRWGEPENVGL